jgi:hypothetical protein
MEFETLLNNKTIKPKEKTEILSQWVTNNANKVNELITFAKASKDPIKATCIESLEYASKLKPELANIIWLEFAIESLSEKAPRIKWESAKVIGNIASLFPKKLDTAISNLLVNSEHEGTVVRWASAYALGEIVKLKLPINKELIPTIETIIEREEKNSIKKIYQLALKKII